jgi:hypothetical protein
VEGCQTPPDAFATADEAATAAALEAAGLEAAGVDTTAFNVEDAFEVGDALEVATTVEGSRWNGSPQVEEEDDTTEAASTVV